MDHATTDGSASTRDASLKLPLDHMLATAVARGGRLTRTSPKFDDMFGMASRSAAGTPILELSAAGDRVRVAQAIQAVTLAAVGPVDPADRGSVKLSFDALRSDGSVFAAELLVTAGEIEDGPATVLFVTDVSERQRAERESASIQWSDARAVGVATVDAQHQRMVALANEFVENLEAGNPPEVIAASLRALMSFTLKHFATEERLMEQHPGWPLQAAHEAEHKRLVDDLASLSLDGEENSAMVIARFLKGWLLGHIEDMDKPMGVWLRDHGVS